MAHLIRFMRGYVRPLWRWYLAGTLAVLLTNWLAVQVPVRMAAGLDALRVGNTAGVAHLAMMIGIIGLAIIATRTASRVWFFTPGRLAEFELREALFAHCLRLQPEFYARFATGDLLSRLTTDVTFARACAGFALLQAINVIGALGLGTWQMAQISLPLTVACALPVVIAFAGMQLGAGKLFQMQRRAQAQLAALSDELLGTLQGIATVQAFTVEAEFGRRLELRASDLRTSNLGMARIRAVTFPLLTVAGGVSIAVIVGVGGPLAIAGETSPGQLAAFVALVVYVLVPMRIMGWLVPLFQRSAASLERIHVVLDAAPERPDADVLAAFPTAVGPALSLRGLTFAYPDAPDRPVLHDLTVDIPAGATVGIYGPTGSGKTTLLRVLSRIRNPPPQSCFAAGVDVRTIDLAQWRKNLTLVPQSPFLFSETIRENVGMGAGEADIRAAVLASSLDPDLEALPDGMDTIVGERGIVLSGGQRQRVALARGLVRHTPLVLLDDVLSAVDHRTEQELIAMLRARHGATRIVVSHRLSALEHADLVLVLDGGRIVDQGVHASLIARAGPYRDAWLTQREAS